MHPVAQVHLVKISVLRTDLPRSIRRINVGVAHPRCVKAFPGRCCVAIGF